MDAKKYKTIDEYHADWNEPQLSRMVELRSFVKTKVPEAVETISYNMPAFKVGKVLCYYAAYKKHIGFYPSSLPIELLKDDLKGYTYSKGAIQLPIDQPIPSDLLNKLLDIRLEQLAK